MRREVLHIAGAILLLSSLVTTIGCDYNSPTEPDNPTPGPVGAEVSITAAGLSPGAVTIAAGQSVTFTNTDTIPHEIVSGPVPTYDACPPINAVGRLEPGQSRQTAAMTNARSCNFVDLLRIGDTRWQGSIAVQ